MEDRDRDSNNPKRPVLFIGLTLLVLAAYASSLPAGLHADDWSHQLIPREFDSLGDWLDPPFPFNTSFRPVYLAYLWGLSKVSAVGIPLARLLVILLHACAVWTVFGLARKWMRTDSVLPAVLAAAWFGVAFCHYEVPNALTNSETPGALFLLLTIASLALWWNALSFTRVCLVLGLWALALLCKEYALWIPAVLAAVWLWKKVSRHSPLTFGERGLQVSPQGKESVLPYPPGRGGGGAKGALLAGMIVLSLLYLGIWAGIDREAEDMADVIGPILSIKGIGNLFSSLASLPLFDPLQERWRGILCDRLGLPEGFLWGLRLLNLAVVIGVGVLALRGLRSAGFFIAWLLILGPLLLTCWLPGDPASRHLYLPSAGFGILIGGSFHYLRDRWNRPPMLAWTVGALLLVEALGSFAVGWELTATTRERERITDTLAIELKTLSAKKTVYLQNLPPKARVNMALYFLFPGWEIEPLTPSPLLKEQPLDRFLRELPSAEEAVVLEWNGENFEQLAPEEFSSRLATP
jgi:hypothetical protein